jgi:hypothetical protein
MTSQPSALVPLNQTATLAAGSDAPGETAPKRDRRPERRGSYGHSAQFLAKQAAADVIGKRKYLDALSKVGTQAAALKAARTARATLWRWREEDLDFTMSERQALDELTDALEAEAMRRAFRGVQRPVYQQGQLVGYVTEYSDAILMMLLKANRPEKFRERVDLQVNSVVKALSGLDPTAVL